MDRAAGLAAELLAGWGPIIRELRLVPSSGGRFEVALDGDLLFSKAALRRHAEPGEVRALVRERLGQEVLEPRS